MLLLLFYIDNLIINGHKASWEIYYPNWKLINGENGERGTLEER